LVTKKVEGRHITNILQILNRNDSEEFTEIAIPLFLEQLSDTVDKYHHAGVAHGDLLGNILMRIDDSC
jgi:tRNA A-37 threonylcarbamoyl transferase component Bud32